MGGEVGGGLPVLVEFGAFGGGDVLDHVADLVGQVLLDLLPIVHRLGVGGPLVGQLGLLGGQVREGLGEGGGLGHLLEFLGQVLGLGEGLVDVLVGLLGRLAALGHVGGAVDLAGLLVGGRDFVAQVLEFGREAGEGPLGGLGGHLGGGVLGLAQVLAHAVGVLGHRVGLDVRLAGLLGQGAGVALGLLEVLNDLLEALADGLLLGLDALDGVGCGGPVDLDGDGARELLSGAAECFRPVVGGPQAEGELADALQRQVREDERRLPGRRSAGLAAGAVLRRQGDGHARAFAAVGGHHELGLAQAVVVGHGVRDGQAVGGLEAQVRVDRVQDTDSGRAVGHRLEHVLGRCVLEAVPVAHGQRPPPAHLRRQGHLEGARGGAVRAGGDGHGRLLERLAVHAQVGLDDGLVERGRHGHLGAGDGLDVAGEVVVRRGFAAGVGGERVLGVEPLDERRRHDLGVVEAADGVAGVDAVSERGDGGRQGHGEPRLAVGPVRQGGHVLGLLGPVGHLAPQAAPFDGGAGHLDVDLQPVPLGQDRVAGPDGEHVGRDVRQIHERGDRALQKPRCDRRIEGPQAAQHHRHADGRQQKRPGRPQGNLGPRPDAQGVVAGLLGQGRNQNRRAAHLRNVAARQEFHGGTQPLVEFGMPGLDGSGDARQRNRPRQRQHERPHGDRDGQAHGRQRQRPADALRKEDEGGVGGHDQQQGADGRRHDRRHAAHQDHRPHAANQAAKGPGDRLGHLARNGCRCVCHLTLTPLSFGAAIRRSPRRRPAGAWAASSR